MTNFATDCKIHHILNCTIFSISPYYPQLISWRLPIIFTSSPYHNKNLTPTLNTGKNIGTWKQLDLRPAIRSTVSKFKMYNIDRSEGGGGVSAKWNLLHSQITKNASTIILLTYQWLGNFFWIRTWYIN